MQADTGFIVPLAAISQPMRFALVFTALLWITGCAGSRLTLTDHPLVGQIWEPAQDRFISQGEAESRVATADIALLGEIHDNPVHHQIQTWLLQRVIARGKRPILAMEQFDTEWQAAITAAQNARTDSGGIAGAGHFGTGWDWSFYRPLVVQALKERLPIVAANLSRARTRKIASEGLAALESGELEWLPLGIPWTARQNAILRRMLVEGHCGEDNPMIDRLIPVQRSRDALMADKITGSKGGAVAIIGRSHARHDVAVPLYIKALAPEKTLLSLGFIEVEPGQEHPTDYSDAAPGLHDLVWFTPRTKRPDPCEGFQSTGRTSKPPSSPT